MKKKIFSLCTLMALLLSAFAFSGVQASETSNEVILVADNSQNDPAMGSTVKEEGFWAFDATAKGHYKSQNTYGSTTSQKMTFKPILEAGKYAVYMARYSEDGAWGGIGWTMGEKNGSVNMGAYNDNEEEYCIKLGVMNATGNPESDSVVLQGTGGEGFAYFTALKFVKINTDEVTLVADNSKNDPAMGSTVAADGFWSKAATAKGHYQSQASYGSTTSQKMTFKPELSVGKYAVYMAQYSEKNAWGNIGWTMGEKSGNVNVGAYNSNEEEYCIKLGVMNATGEPEQDSVVLQGTGGEGFAYFTALKFVKIKNTNEVILVADNSKNDFSKGSTEWISSAWTGETTAAGHYRSYGPGGETASKIKMAFKPVLYAGEYDVYMAKYSNGGAWGSIGWTMGENSGVANIGAYNDNTEEYCISLGTMNATGDPEQDSIVLQGTGGGGYAYLTALKFVKITEESKAKQKLAEDFNACTTAKEVYKLLSSNKDLTGIDVDNTGLIYSAPVFERLKKESCTDFDSLVAKINSAINSEKEAPVLSLYDSDENQVTSLQPGIFVFDGSNVNISDGAKVAVAVYGDGKLKAVECTAYSSEDQMIQIDFTNSAIAGEDTLGLFVWESFGDLKPVELY